ncbi:hypothetical protein GC207_11105 [bacterium]|nr:hypothetical protein [bacterium]
MYLFKSNQLDRRGFLKVAAAGFVAWPALAETLTSKLSETGNPKIGLIGLGERGLFLLERFQQHCTVAAVCDIHRGRLQSGAAKGSHELQQFSDYRRLLANNSLTGVVIATPDHWHARIAIDALKAGKHVFCETPVCRTLTETAALIAAASNAKLKTQVGIQGRANSAAFAACRYIREGQIGKVHTVRFWSPPDRAFTPLVPVNPPPAELDWPLWLGPLRERPYDKGLFDGNWRFVEEIGGGYLMSRGSQLFALLSWFLGRELDGQVEVGPKTGLAKHPQTGAAHKIHLEFVLRNLGLRCQWETTTDFVSPHEPQHPPAPALSPTGGEGVRQDGRERTTAHGPHARPQLHASAAHDPDWGMQCVGDKGELTMLGGDADCQIKAEVFAYKSRRNSDDVEWNFAPDHRLNWLQCIAGASQPTMPIERAARAAAVCIVGKLARRLDRKVVWDFEKNEFVDDPEANRLRDAAVEGNPWTVRL